MGGRTCQDDGGQRAGAQRHGAQRGHRLWHVLVLLLGPGGTHVVLHGRGRGRGRGRVSRVLDPWLRWRRPPPKRAVRGSGGRGWDQRAHARRVYQLALPCTPPPAARPPTHPPATPAPPLSRTPSARPGCSGTPPGLGRVEKQVGEKAGGRSRWGGRQQGSRAAGSRAECGEGRRAGGRAGDQMAWRHGAEGGAAGSRQAPWQLQRGIDASAGSPACHPPCITGHPLTLLAHAVAVVAVLARLGQVDGGSNLQTGPGHGRGAQAARRERGASPPLQHTSFRSAPPTST